MIIFISSYFSFIYYLVNDWSIFAFYMVIYYLPMSKSSFCEWKIKWTSNGNKKINPILINQVFQFRCVFSFSRPAWFFDLGLFRFIHLHLWPKFLWQNWFSFLLLLSSLGVRCPKGEWYESMYFGLARFRWPLLHLWL